MASIEPEVTLYTYFRSSCSARLRIALNLKQIPYESIYVNLLKGGQSSTEYDDVNPSHSVPTVQCNRDPKLPVTITQSIAALEFLEETYTDRLALLPPISDAEARSAVRILVNIIACDTQPVTNLRILKRVAALSANNGGNLTEVGAAREEWARELMTEGLRAYERVASITAGRYSVGGSITLADVCLVPAVWGAQRYGVDLGSMPVISRIFDEMTELDAVVKAHWQNQGDTPEEMRSRSKKMGGM